MLYHAYQAQSDFTSPLRLLAQANAALWRPAGGRQSLVRGIAAASEVYSLMRLTHSRPDYGIASVTEVPVLKLPFGTLLHFRRTPRAEAAPRVLLVAPLSGHFATLLRDTLRVLLADHDVYVTDWHNARDVALRHGGFGLDDYIDYLVKFLTVLGGDTHVVAVCQPCVAALAATALMAEDGSPATPRSLTLMAGPVDCRINPTGVNVLATSKPIEWFERTLISHVPPPHAGHMRRVYPGFVQLHAFMSMNAERHRAQFVKLHEHLLREEEAQAQAIRDFYDEYLAVNDLPAEFYLETVEKVFQTYDLARGELYWRGRRVNPGAIRSTWLLTVEGERDDICAIGQTVAAQDLCTGIRPWMKEHHMQAGVGHYGVFSGRRWAAQIYPRVRATIHAAAELATGSLRAAA